MSLNSASDELPDVEAPFRWPMLPPSSPLPVLVGVVLLVAGFVLMTVGWSAVAGEESVPLQMPYVFSCGFPGIGLVVLGVGTINVAVKRRESAERTRQLDQLADLVERIQRSLDADEGR